ncbi:hypothetical protein [Yoonia sediminilitoris]|uniref:Thioredoxin-like protein n=1 Tax=Yoonia sediminilitoris TaxID=1286148 RepID=A0A2T6KQV5_9RHOB|nr:hypothetical protein [Yoonia sediminilitoris]PUB18915.1 hypothetical protein C8N45_101506 [Yoonia sediminilitoris]RCW99083.1 hypothetical protein DFP92_101506 [Yoonia sediminilitoris]
MCKRLAILFVLLVLPLFASAKPVLVMAEEPGCIWCARWNEEIGPIYPKTGEGIAAPLRRYDITTPVPDDIELARRVNFTPTFILLINGVEQHRIEGYPGEDFFWGLLGQMLEKEDIAFSSEIAK